MSLVMYNMNSFLLYKIIANFYQIILTDNEENEDSDDDGSTPDVPFNNYDVE